MNKETREKVNTIFNEIRQFAYVLGARGRERFQFAYVLGVRGRERFYWFNNQYNLYFTYNLRELCHLVIAKETQEFRKPQLDSSPIQNEFRILKGEIDLRPDTPVGRPGSRPTQVPSRPVGGPCLTESSSCQSVDRSPATVDRAIDRAALCTFVHTGQLGGRPALLLA